MTTVPATGSDCRALHRNRRDVRHLIYSGLELWPAETDFAVDDGRAGPISATVPGADAGQGEVGAGCR